MWYFDECLNHFNLPRKYHIIKLHFAIQDYSTYKQMLLLCKLNSDQRENIISLTVI